MNIRPDYANIEENGVLKRVDPSEITVGSIIVVQPGEKIPLDGIAESGLSSQIKVRFQAKACQGGC